MGFGPPGSISSTILFIAVWFALNEHKRRNGQFCYEHSAHGTGWVHFVGTRAEGHSRLLLRDLRREHSSHSLRPHAQHGWSVTRWARNDWSGNNLDLSPYILVSVEIPNDTAFWRLSGFMFGQAFLFPSPEHDHPYGVLLPRMAKVLGEVEKQFQLPGALGQITRYQ